MPIAEYKSYLRTQGASEDDIKALTEGSFAQSAIRAFDAQQSHLAAEADRLKAEAEARVADYKKKADDWYESVAQPNLTRAEADARKATAEAARLRSLVAQSTDEGLRKVAEEMGYKLDGTSANPNPSNSNPNPGNPSFDPNKYFTRDEIVQIAQREGEAIAIAQDIAYEHRALFPDRPLNFRDLRAKATAANKPVEQYWMDTYGVPAAREKRDSEQKAAYEKKLREEGAAEARRQYAEAAANPNMIPGSTSINPLAARPTAGREKQPWEAGLDSSNGSNDRVARAAKVFAEKQSAGARTN